MVTQEILPGPLLFNEPDILKPIKISSLRQGDHVARVSNAKIQKRRKKLWIEEVRRGRQR